MPPEENICKSKIFFKIDNEVFRPISGDVVAMLSNEPETEDISEGESVSFFKDRVFEETFEMSEDSKQLWNIFCNNWRKMHGLPLIRKRGLRKCLRLMGKGMMKDL